MSAYVCVCVYVCVCGCIVVASCVHCCCIVVALLLHQRCIRVASGLRCVCGGIVVASCVHVVVAGSLLFTLSCELLFSESHLLIALVSGQVGQKEVWGCLTSCLS